MQSIVLDVNAQLTHPSDRLDFSLERPGTRLMPDDQSDRP